MNRYKLAAQIGLFLISKDQPTYGHWSGKLTAAEQREWFGVFLGKGHIHVNGLDEIIEMNVTVCFGTDTSTVASLNAKIPGNSFVNDYRPQVKEAIAQLN